MTCATAKEVESFSRPELWGLISRVRQLAETVVNPTWKRTYGDLAHALNVLDAQIARSTVVDSATSSA